MEIKINKEIRNFTEKIFFGLSLRQFVCSFFACCIALIIYFIFYKKFGLEVTSWICILFASPFAFLGFVKYNGMTAEQFIFAFLSSNILSYKNLKFKSINYYELLMNNFKEVENVKDK